MKTKEFEYFKENIKGLQLAYNEENNEKMRIKKVWQCGPWKDTILTNDLSSFKPMIENVGIWQNLPPYGITG